MCDLLTDPYIELLRSQLKESTMIEIDKKKFIEHLTNSGWSEKDAIAEWEWIQSNDGDVDGDMYD